MPDVRRSDHFINGAPRKGASGERHSRHSPAHGGLLAEFAAGDARDVNEAVLAARTAFNAGWSATSGEQRATVLNAFAALIDANADRLAAIEAEEVGKPVRFARFEIGASAQLARYAAALAWQLSGQSFNNLGEDKLGLVTREPCGVVGLITPWNFPLLTLFQKLPYALAAGCTVVLKPSELTSGTALEVAALAVEAGLPAGVFNVVTGTGEAVGNALVTHKDVDMISFTGSTRVGKQIAREAAGTMKRVALELGGKAANIVFADADFEAAIDGVLFGFILNQGQECVAGARLLLEASIAPRFLEELKQRTGRLKIGLPLDQSVDVSSLIHEAHLESVLGHVASAQREGAEVVVGGKRLGDEFASGFFMAPTIVTGVSPDMRLFREEVFGPVLSVTTFDSVEEAVALANDTDYGLANGVWTMDINKALTIARRLRSGTVFVNTYLETAPQLPFGGYKQSGQGRENGLEGLLEFTEIKSTVVKLGPREAIFGHTAAAHQVELETSQPSPLP
ncbi:aldehyde dehydrogenase family protein [Sphingopyxis terrae]|uniref:aldehyde dehydrogenase family protein n=1 Tax=Sphingopyxis terrae TaxID=33052 RepID=UPI002A0FE535|nr:aldehyde dehydrogenase family protein [Sphingopyxis terrae]MDX8356477.1 aldehyde dehydrogenase family protein [Sphingopyxis terrae]